MMEYADRAPDIVVRFDDVLTTGLNFKGIEIVLGERFPGVTVFDLFLARAVCRIDSLRVYRRPLVHWLEMALVGSSFR
jgi:hypothetical protein